MESAFGKILAWVLAICMLVVAVTGTAAFVAWVLG